MNDQRHLIAGVLAGIALVGGVVLIALQRDAAQIATVLGTASTFGAYALGLQSETYGGGE